MPDSTAPQSQIEQVEGDEELAKKLQEQMDMEFAMSLQNLENQPPVFGAGAFPHHDVASPNPAVAYNRGPMAVGQGRWATTQRGRTTSRYPDLDEVEALLRDLDEPEERLLQHSPQGRPMTRNGAWTQQTGQHFLEDIAHLNSSLLSMLEGGSPFIGQPVARHSRSRRRGQRRNTNPRGLDIGSPADGNDYEDLLNLAEMLGDVKNKGLTEAQSSRLPVRTYQANGDKQDSEDCLICMCEYDQGDRLKMLPCFHEFHSQCIDKWIMGNASCPVCRVEVKLT
ncbi:E3 ubiquitin-protein ligase RNF6-like [Pecten maximus]|uniref:E3 ubiquitin-protein ligase RNF6-like n=1 Tax=Pecten maximus TaxID=6579 RepID=UPI0014587CA2|nr:E3 ubiquitin-protein ligase RNF6-like [Pecten maximus]